jgi:GNAT superfamily N-acetyltransferase
MSTEIKVNTEINFDQLHKIIALAMTATVGIYKEKAKPSQIKALQNMVPAISGSSNLFLACAVVDGDVAGFQAGYLSPMVLEEGDAAYSFITYVKPEAEGKGIGEQLFMTFVQWAEQRKAVDIRLELTNATNNDALAVALEARGFGRQGIVMLKRG